MMLRIRIRGTGGWEEGRYVWCVVCVCVCVGGVYVVCGVCVCDECGV